MKRSFRSGMCGALLGAAALFILLASPVSAGQNQVRRINQQGNQLYTEEQWAEALEAYTTANEIDPESAVLHYNLGNALYRLNDLDKAETHYRVAAAGEDPDLARQARFNLGNTDFRRAETLEGAGDWQGRNQALAKAIENWKSVLEMDPQNRDAKFNLEIARQKLLEEPPENEQQQQQQDQQDEEQNEEQNEEQDQNQEQQQDQQQDQQEEQEQQEQQQDQQEEQRNESDEDPQDQQEEQAEAEPQDGEGQEQAGDEQMDEMRISPEEAERILDALRDEELEEQRRQMAERKGRGGSAERDW